MLVQQSIRYRHQIVALKAGGATIETLECTAVDEPDPFGTWGLPSKTIGWMIAYAVWHAATGTMPNECPEGDDA